MVIYGRDATVAESVHPLGQSGMITLAGQLDPHFADQLPLFGVFETCRRLGKRSDVPIIMLTAFDQAGEQAGWRPNEFSSQARS